MNDQRLPDDPSRWPQDPYELLAVARDGDRNALRRAYTGLVRRYKPEHFPEQFRRIRTAYEQVLQFLEWRETWGVKFADPPDDDANPIADSAPVTEAGSPGSPDQAASDVAPGPSSDVVDSKLPVTPSIDPEKPVAEPQPPAQRRAPPSVNIDQELDQLWEWACDGQEAAAYFRLIELAQQHPERDDVFARLYWLLVSDPPLDEARTALDWLVRGLQGTGLASKLRNLYERELAQDPSQVRAERSAELLNTPADAAALAAIARARWRAAGRLNQWDVITSDLALLRPELPRHSELVWAGLLMDAIEQLAWATTGSGRQQLEEVHQELSGLEHLHLAMSHQFDRLDYLLTVASGWRTLLHEGGIPRVLLTAIPLSWHGPSADSHEALERLAQSMLDGTETALGWLDRVRDKSPVVLVHLKDALQELKHYDPETPDEDREVGHLLPALRRLLLDRLGYHYSNVRLQILHFCIREAVAPWRLADLVSSHRDLESAYGVDLAECFRQDLPLHCVYVGHHVYWS